MIARMLLLWLLVLNLGVAAWWAFHRAPAPPAPAPLARALPTLELIEGRVADAASSGLATPAVAPAPVQPALPSAEAASPPPAAETTVTPPAPMVCARFGPFADEATTNAARESLAGNGAQASVRRVGPGGVRGYTVSMPPLPSREQATAMAERLRAAGFTDLMVINQGEAANGIALGRFGSEENARRHQSALQAKGFGAQVAPVGGEGSAPQWWLDVRAPAGFDAQAARARVGAAQVQPRGC